MMGAMRVVVGQYEGIDATPVLPLAAGVLIATARRDPALAGASYDVVIERRPVAEAAAAMGDGGPPDVIGLSLYPWNAAYSLAVAAAARRAYPDALIVAGGPSVPRRPERARQVLDEQPAIDVLAFGEGEVTFPALLRARRAGAALDPIAGLAVRRADGAHLVTAPPERVLDLGATGSPYLDGTFDALWARHRGRFSMALCETNRGCPFSCTFCDWSLTKRVVEFPLERVHAELAWVVDHGLGHLMLADANFGIRPRDLALTRHLAALRAATGRPSSFYFYLTKNDHARNLETIELLHDAQIATWVGLAVQDFDDDVLAAVQRDNIQTGEANRLRELCGARGIPTFNELILGLPGQTYASFTQTVATAMAGYPRHDFVLFLCRLIDNAELGSPASRARHGLVTRRCRWPSSTPGWDPVVDEQQEVVVGTSALPVEDWARAFRYAFLAAALYNLRLLRVVLRHVGEGLGLDLRAYVAQLDAAVATAPAGTVYATLRAELDRFAGSILAGGPFALPPPGDPDAPGASDDSAAPVYVDEALAHVALARYDAFLAETAAHTRAFVAGAGAAAPGAAAGDDALGDDALAEAFRYQALITPRWGERAPREEAFAHDWPAYVAAGGTGAALAARAVTVRFTPPPYAGATRRAEAIATHLACVRARLEIGTAEVVDVVDAAPGRGSRRLVVLPAHG